VISILLLSTGNIGVLWGEEYVSSGLASLIVALVPIWVVMIEAWIFRAGRMTTKGWLAGHRDCRVAGAAVAADHFRHTSGTAGTSGRGHSGWSVVFLGTGVSVFPSLQPDGGRFRFRRVAMTLGGLVNGVIALVTGQFQKTHWTTPALAGIGYLVVFGSWIGYTAYIYLLEHVPRRRWQRMRTSIRLWLSFWAGLSCTSR